MVNLMVMVNLHGCPLFKHNHTNLYIALQFIYNEKYNKNVLQKYTQNHRKETLSHALIPVLNTFSNILTTKIASKCLFSNS
jgi:hypothetical protein